MKQLEERGVRSDWKITDPAWWITSHTFFTAWRLLVVVGIFLLVAILARADSTFVPIQPEGVWYDHRFKVTMPADAEIDSIIWKIRPAPKQWNEFPAIIYGLPPMEPEKEREGIIIIWYSRGLPPMDDPRCKKEKKK